MRMRMWPRECMGSGVPSLRTLFALTMAPPARHDGPLAAEAGDGMRMGCRAEEVPRSLSLPRSCASRRPAVVSAAVLSVVGHYRGRVCIIK